MTRVRLTNQDRLIVLGLTLILFFGIFLLGNGIITGSYLIDFEQPYCSNDDECYSGKVCCNFYKEDSGVCDVESNCHAIEQITKEEKEKISSDLYLEGEYKFSAEDKLNAMKTISSHLEKPQAPSKWPSIITGIILLVLGALWIVYLRKG